MLIGSAFLMLIRYYVVALGGFAYVFAGYQVICIVVQWDNVGKYFSFLAHYAEHNKKRKELRIIELFCFTLVMAHIFVMFV
jgi:hypothetical protein